MPEFTISTAKSEEVIDMTERVESIVRKSGVKEGLCLVYVPHTTACVLITEADGAVEQDVLNSLSSIVPKSSKYRHEHGAPGHGASHVKAALLGPSKAIPVSEGSLKLGTWQRIVFFELDGPRERRIIVELVGK